MMASPSRLDEPSEKDVQDAIHGRGRGRGWELMLSEIDGSQGEIPSYTTLNSSFIVLEGVICVLKA